MSVLIPMTSCIHLVKRGQREIDKWQILDKYSMDHNGRLTLSKYFKWACQ